MKAALLASLAMLSATAVSSPVASPAAILRADTAVVIHAAHALDGRGGRIDDAWIVVRGGRIESVGHAKPAVAGASTIELKGATLLPGLIDAHVHPGWYVDKRGKRNSRQSGDTPAEAFAARAKNLEVTLLAGFTTIQSVGGPEDLELRDSVNAKRIAGPRLLTSITQLSDVRVPPDSLRSQVRALKARGADLIKLFASSGLGAGGAQLLSDEQIGAICSEAKAVGLRTLVHAISAQSVRAATLAGCTQIEHGTFVTDAELKLMAEHGTIFDPQVCLVFQNYIDHPDAYSFNDSTLRPLRAAIPTATAMFAKAIKTPNLKIVFGTDAVALAHGRNADELLCRVSAGQSPMDAIVSATSAAAQALGMGDHLGALAVGDDADIIATDGDPSRDISATKR